MTYEERAKLLRSAISELEKRWLEGKPYDRLTSDLFHQMIELAIKHGKVSAGEELADKWNKSLS